MIELVLYSRSYCHLCDDMRDAVMQYRGEVVFDLEIVDVDADPHLVAQYDELVPVLAARTADGTTRTLCHHFLDQRALGTLFAEGKVRDRGAGTA
ncbi:MAG: glutaredoxin family protein [Herminiimonas sp.]|nr:glutaredoxin family protein [Herminiimonas sp.]